MVNDGVGLSTGTPVQNRLETLVSVTKFLHIYPYNERSFSAHILSRVKLEDPLYGESPSSRGIHLHFVALRQD